MVETCKKFTSTFVPVVSHSNNVSNNEIMTNDNNEYWNSHLPTC